MRSFLQRSHRIRADLQISLLLMEMGSNNVVAAPVVGVLYNISEVGACVDVTSPLSSGHHLFYRTLNSDRFLLLLEGSLPDDPAWRFSVAAASVWMKGVEDGIAGFRIGLVFRDTQRHLFLKIKQL